MSEQSRRATVTSLAVMLYPGTGQPAAAGIVDRGVHRDGLGKRPRRSGAFTRLLRGLGNWVVAGHERRATDRALSEMSDRDLADIGLTRSLIHDAFDPAFARGKGVPPAAASEQELRMLAALSLNPCTPRLLARC